MKRLSIAALFLVIFLSGCVTTGGPTAGQQLDSLTDSISSKFASLKSPVGTDPVMLNFTGFVGYYSDSDQVSEVFYVLPDVSPGAVQDPDSAQVVSKIGSILQANPRMTGYVYINPADARSPLVNSYNSVVEQIAGKSRSFIKYDARLSLVHTPVVWLADPTLAMAQDALLAAEKHGLTTPKVPTVAPVATR